MHSVYRIIVERKASKEIEFLDSCMLKRVTDAILKLKDNPRPHNVKKLAVDGGWRIRVGVFRILYIIDDSQKLVTIYRVKHRKESYRNN